MQAHLLHICYFSTSPDHLEWVQFWQQVLLNVFQHPVEATYNALQPEKINLCLFTEFSTHPDIITQSSAITVVINQSCIPYGYDQSQYTLNLLSASYVINLSPFNIDELTKKTVFHSAHSILKFLPPVVIQPASAGTAATTPTKILYCCNDIEHPNHKEFISTIECIHIEQWTTDAVINALIAECDMLILQGIFDQAVWLKICHKALRLGKIVITEWSHADWVDPIWANEGGIFFSKDILRNTQRLSQLAKDPHFIQQHRNTIQTCYLGQSFSTHWIIDPIHGLIEHLSNPSLFSHHPLTKQASLQPPLISVVVPIFNASRYLSDTLSSIYTQTHRPLELILIDDGSNDNSVQIAQDFMKAHSSHDFFITLQINPKNQGVSSARNDGISKATGQYLAFWDADDCAPPERLRKLAHLLTIKPEVGIVGSWFNVINENGDFEPAGMLFPTKASDIHTYLLASSTGAFLFGSCMIRLTDPIIRNTRFDPQLTVAEDLGYVYSMVTQGIQINNIPEFLYYYRQHSNSASKKSVRQNMQGIQKVKAIVLEYFFPSLTPTEIRTFCMAYNEHEPEMYNPAFFRQWYQLVLKIKQLPQPPAPFEPSIFTGVLRSLLFYWLTHLVKSQVFNNDEIMGWLNEANDEVLIGPLRYQLMLFQIAQRQPQ